MKIRVKIFLVILISFIPTVLIGTIFITQLQAITKPITQDIPANITTLTKATQLNSLSSFIRYYDEVLTQSARNYAFTGDTKWKTRYHEEAPKLDEIIKQAIAEGDSQDQQFFFSIDSANIALVAMEESSMALVDQGQKRAAIAILEGDEYATQKEIYKNGLVNYVQRKGFNYDQALTASTRDLDSAVQTSRSLISASLITSLVILVISLISSFTLAAYFSRLITDPIIKLRNISRQIHDGQTNLRANISTNDEIGELARAFNDMTDKLRQSRDSVEQKVKERTSQLHRLNQVMVGRELKMIELKKEIETLKKNPKRK